jgi:hypothetical protein
MFYEVHTLTLTAWEFNKLPATCFGLFSLFLKNVAG